jgi:hypothetical protein
MLERSNSCGRDVEVGNTMEGAAPATVELKASLRERQGKAGRCPTLLLPPKSGQYQTAPKLVVSLRLRVHLLPPSISINLQLRPRFYFSPRLISLLHIPSSSSSCRKLLHFSPSWTASVECCRPLLQTAQEAATVYVALFCCICALETAISNYFIASMTHEQTMLI